MAPKMDEGMRLAERCNALIALAEERGYTVRMHYEGENRPPRLTARNSLTGGELSQLNGQDAPGPYVSSQTLEITVSRYTDAAAQISAYHRLIDALEEVLGIAPRPVTLPVAVDRGMRL